MQVRKHASEVIHPGFETQSRRYQKSKTGVSVASQKGLVSYKNYFKKKNYMCSVCPSSAENDSEMM